MVAFALVAQSFTFFLDDLRSWAVDTFAAFLHSRLVFFFFSVLHFWLAILQVSLDGVFCLFVLILFYFFLCDVPWGFTSDRSFLLTREAFLVESPFDSSFSPVHSSLVEKEALPIESHSHSLLKSRSLKTREAFLIETPRRSLRDSFSLLETPRRQAVNSALEGLVSLYSHTSNSSSPQISLEPTPSQLQLSSQLSSSVRVPPPSTPITSTTNPSPITDLAPSAGFVHSLRASIRARIATPLTAYVFSLKRPNLVQVTAAVAVLSLASSSEADKALARHLLALADVETKTRLEGSYRHLSQEHIQQNITQFSFLTVLRHF
jgi:hypothetical protein